MILPPETAKAGLAHRCPLRLAEHPLDKKILWRFEFRTPLGYDLFWRYGTCKGILSDFGAEWPDETWKKGLPLLFTWRNYVTRECYWMRWKSVNRCSMTHVFDWHCFLNYVVLLPSFGFPISHGLTDSCPGADIATLKERSDVRCSKRATSTGLSISWMLKN